MYIPNLDVYNILKSVGGIEASQQRPEDLVKYPSVTYYIANNKVNSDLSKEISYQEVEVVVDIWTTTSKEGTELLSQIEASMRENGFMLSFSSDISEANGRSHITSRFNLII